MRYYFFALFIALSISACSGGPGGLTGTGDGPPQGPAPPGDPPPGPPGGPPTFEPAVPTILQIPGPELVALSPGDLHNLDLAVFDQYGRRMTTVPGLVLRSTAETRATVRDDGFVVGGEEFGLAWIHAQVGALRDSVAVWIQRRQGEPSDFEITLVYSARVPDYLKPYIEDAADRWEEVIRGRLPEVEVATLQNACGWIDEPPPALLQGVEDGVRLYVQVSDLFPKPTFVPAVGGPCIQRALPHPTTVVGAITLNSDKFEPRLQDWELRALMHHEMGHTLGLVGAVQFASPPWLDQANGTYRGYLGLYGFELDFGSRPSGLSFADGGHWDFPDIMGNQLPHDRITHATAGALMDLGYPAAWYGAGPIAIF